MLVGVILLRAATNPEQKASFIKTKDAAAVQP